MLFLLKKEKVKNGVYKNGFLGQGLRFEKMCQINLFLTTVLQRL